LFSATIQDNDIGLIFGEDSTTGAGGANVVTYNSFLSKSNPTRFPILPLVGSSKFIRQDIRVAWRQVVRVKRNNGKIIEDFGVATDIKIRPTLQDLLNRTISTPYDYISDRLMLLGQATGTSRLYIKVFPENDVDVIQGNNVHFSFELQGVSRIMVFSVDTFQMVGQVDISSQNRNISIPFRPKNPGWYRFQIQALDKNNNVVFSTYRNIRIIPMNKLKLQSGVETNLLLQAPFSGTFNLNTVSKDGFQISNNQLKLGFPYQNKIDSQYSWFFDAGSSTSLQWTISMDYDTEKGFDLVSAGYQDQYGTYQLLVGEDAEGFQVDGISGKGILNQTFTIQFEGPVEVFVRFVSDEHTTFQGIQLHHVTVIAE
jgi:hypothetical protein